MLERLIATTNATVQRWLPTAAHVWAALLAIAVLTSTYLGLRYQQPIYMIAAPVIVILAYVLLTDFKPLFYLLMASLAFSIEYRLGSLSTDLPSEPLMWVGMVLFSCWVLTRPAHWDRRLLWHPLIALLVLHFCWTCFAALLSQQPLISAKFVAAKTWYIVVFAFWGAHIIDSERRLHTLMAVALLPLVCSSLIVSFRHYQLDWGFREINQAAFPMFRNHVSYAALLSLSMPLCWALWRTSNHTRWRSIWILATLVFAYGIALSYTRAAYIALLLVPLAYWAIRWRLMRWAAPLGFIFIGLLTAYMIRDNRFMRYVPSTSTVSHEEFSSIVSATSKLEDISTMERYHRWIGGAYMVAERPWAGWGPGTFPHLYKPYTLLRFRTYVSANPEGSGIHSYYLMTLVEQGVPGLLIFLLLVLGTLLWGERLYHRTTHPHRRTWVMALLLSLVVINAFQLINDLLETDKVGSYFLLYIGLLVRLDLLQRDNTTLQQQPPQQS